jgi:hypothetical protein
MADLEHKIRQPNEFRPSDEISLRASTIIFEATKIIRPKKVVQILLEIFLHTKPKTVHELHLRAQNEASNTRPAVDSK